MQSLSLLIKECMLDVVFVFKTWERRDVSLTFLLNPPNHKIISLENDCLQTLEEVLQSLSMMNTKLKILSWNHPRLCGLS